MRSYVWLEDMGLRSLSKAYQRDYYLIHSNRLLVIKYILTMFFIILISIYN